MDSERVAQVIPGTIVGLEDGKTALGRGKEVLHQVIDGRDVLNNLMLLAKSDPLRQYLPL